MSRNKNSDWILVETPCPKCKKSDQVYIQCFDDEVNVKDFYCTGCCNEWDANTEDEAELLAEPETVDSIDDYISSSGKGSSSGASKGYVGGAGGYYEKGLYHSYGGSGGGRPFCTVDHYPTKVINGEGWGVWVGEKWKCSDKANEFDVVMNLTFDSIKKSQSKHVIPIPELKKWEKMTPAKKNFVEIQMDWPDMKTIPAPLAFWKDVIKYLKDEKKDMLMFCLGGHGRTGTALASLMVAAEMFEPDGAIKWIRKNYCARAIETTEQEEYIRNLIKKKEKK